MTMKSFWSSTPKSWMDEDESYVQKASHGPMPPSGELPEVISQGPMPPEEDQQPQAAKKQRVQPCEELERSMEKLMMEHVFEQNQALWEELKVLKGAVGRQGPGSSPPRAPPTAPKMARYTPQGTRVPDSPIEKEWVELQMPEWPDSLRDYATAGESHQREERRIGSEAAETLRARTERGRTPSPREARMLWLEREVQSLQSVLKEQYVGKRMAGYWLEDFEKDRDGDRVRRERSRDRRADVGRSDEKKGGEEHHEDLLRSFPITLPRLADPAEKHAALLAGDWITQVRPMIADVSARAGLWWDEVVSHPDHVQVSDVA